MKILLAFIFKAFGHFINRDSERTDKNDMEEMDNRTWNWPKDLYFVLFQCLGYVSLNTKCITYSPNGFAVCLFERPK